MDTKKGPRVFDAHALRRSNLAYPEYNQGLWCGAYATCTRENEQGLYEAWRTLALDYCTRPNVLGADLFKYAVPPETRPEPCMWSLSALCHAAPLSQKTECLSDAFAFLVPQ